jgi:hypothetical protein
MTSVPCMPIALERNDAASRSLRATIGATDPAEPRRHRPEALRRVEGEERHHSRV